MLVSIPYKSVNYYWIWQFVKFQMTIEQQAHLVHSQCPNICIHSFKCTTL